MRRLLDALWNEHRSIAVVLHAMLHLVRAQAKGEARVNPAAFRAMLYYLDVFPERVHHPKEEKVLFAAIRARSLEGSALLDELGREHEAGGHAIRDLEQALLRYEEGGEAGFASFAEVVERFVQGYREHMRREEEEVMPLARRVLTEADWAALDAEWATHRDPLAGVDPEAAYDRVLDRIVALAPPPIGTARP